MGATTLIGDVGHAPRRGGGRDLLRFITCGSVDDGKSTLIGRLLLDCRLILDDQLASLERDSVRFGNAGRGRLDPALLVDGLEAEREQGITIDVAHRFFDTGNRRFIVADTPGHEQYTRNMATGASTAEAAVLLVDAKAGVLTQTRRHAFIVSLFGIRHVILAVNKMDTVDWDRSVFDRVAADFRAVAGKLGIADVPCAPMSALLGDNVARRSKNMPWYDGPTLLERLESIPAGEDETARPFRFPVQWVNRPDSTFRGYAGTIATGAVRPGDRVAVLPAGREATVERIVTFDGDLPEASAARAVTLTLVEDVDVSRGDMIAHAAARPEISDILTAHVVWMAEAPLTPGRSHLLRTTTATVGAWVTRIKYKINVDTLEPAPARNLELNAVGVCELALDRAIPFDPHAENRATGGFILIDRTSNATVGCGMIDFAPRRSHNIHCQATTIDRSAREALNGAPARVLWFTGLSGSGKSTIADAVERDLHVRGYHTMLLDGDNVRRGLNRDLGFTEVDRVENIRRVAEVAKLMVEAGVIVLVCLISPYRSERRAARELFAEGEFLEIHVDTPLEVCEARDSKGLYKKARAGRLPNLTGVDSPYEPPLDPELVLRSDGALTPEALAAEVVRAVETTLEAAGRARNEAAPGPKPLEI